MRAAGDGDIAAAANNTAITLANMGQAELLTQRTKLEQELAAKMAAIDAGLKKDARRSRTSSRRWRRASRSTRSTSSTTTLKVNGITVDPKGELHTMIVPSDATLKDGGRRHRAQDDRSTRRTRRRCSASCR